jgi:hypothetical protein
VVEKVALDKRKPVLRAGGVVPEQVQAMESEARCL